MTSKQYEELCRYFIADMLKISFEQVRSIRIPNPTRSGLPEYKHQIDLYWETEDEIARYFNIANAKWRKVEKVDQPEVLLIQQVKQKVGAHKALMITNTGFTAGAVAVAQDEGNGLHIVRPTFDTYVLPNGDSEKIQSKFVEIDLESEQRIYSHQFTYKSYELYRDKDSEGEEIFATNDEEETYSSRAEIWYLAVLEQRQDYLIKLWQLGYDIDIQEIITIENEIKTKAAPEVDHRLDGTN